MLSQDQITDIQSFHKVYQHVFKQADQVVLETGYSLTERDLLMEMSKTKRCIANTLITQLAIDRSYASRMLKKFEAKGLIQKVASNNDSRMKYIQLTTLGQQEVQRLTDCQREQISQLFSKLTPTEVEALCQVLVQIRNQLTKANDVVTIRSFKPSDIDYIISRHKTLYYAERHLSETFFAYVDQIVYEFVDSYHPETDCLKILVCNEIPAESIAIKRLDDQLAQLRFFMLEPEMRQRGYGNQLMDLALSFCREKGYRQVCLYTITAQVIARHIYETHAFI